jgi:hypothetical protein
MKYYNTLCEKLTDIMYRELELNYSQEYSAFKLKGSLLLPNVHT